MRVLLVDNRDSGHLLVGDGVAQPTRGSCKSLEIYVCVCSDTCGGTQLDGGAVSVGPVATRGVSCQSPHSCRCRSLVAGDHTGCVVVGVGSAPEPYAVVGSALRVLLRVSRNSAGQRRVVVRVCGWSVETHTLRAQHPRQHNNAAYYIPTHPSHTTRTVKNRSAPNSASISKGTYAVRSLRSKYTLAASNSIP